MKILFISVITNFRFTSIITKNIYRSIVCVFTIALISATFSCSKQSVDEIPEERLPTEPEMPSQVDIIIEEYGINPVGKTEINNIFHVVDSVKYKIAVGRKNNKAWVAKFNQNGDEIYSFEVKDVSDRVYSHFNINSFIAFNENALFLMGWASNVDLTDVNNIYNRDYTTFLSVIDFNKGEYCKMVKKIDKPVTFITEEFGNDYILGTYEDNGLTFISNINNRGEILWERPAVDSEKKYWHQNKEKTPLLLYGNYTYIKSDLIAYIISNDVRFERSDIPIYAGYGNYCGIVDIKEPKLIFGFNHETVPLVMEEDGYGMDICFFITKMYCLDNALYMEYKKCNWHYSYDPLTNERLPNTFTDIASYYYKLSIDDFRILEHNKL